MKTAYPNIQDTATITLYKNIPFDNTYAHHSFISKEFKEVAEEQGGTYVEDSMFPNAKQEYFIDRKNTSGQYVYPRYTLTDVFNFEFKNGLVASVILELTNEQTNANYMKVSVGSQDWFYFITSINQTNYGTYALNLELDVLMTYGDEFMEGIQNKPIFTKRKHCSRYKDGFIYCKDLKSGDSAYAGVKPSIIVDKKEYKVNYQSSSANNILNKLRWLYIVVDCPTYCYTLGDNKNPFTIIALPFNKLIKFRYLNNDDSVAGEYVVGFGDINIGIYRYIGSLINDGKLKGAKILPYAPFSSIPNSFAVTEDDNYVIITGHISDNYQIFNASSTENISGTFVVNSCSSRFGNNLGEDYADALKHAMIIEKQSNPVYATSDFEILPFSETERTITSNKVEDVRLQFSPFKKYVLTSASGGEFEFYPELICSQKSFSSLIQTRFKIYTIATAYGGDYSTYSYLVSNQSNSAFSDYNYGKIGLSTVMNYTVPVGENALDVFMSTQSETYYQSKMASGITSGLTIAGGIASIGIGVVGAVASEGLSTPMSVGLIASGVTAIAGGTASMVNTIKSTNAKMEDLQNTPNAINVSGSSYAHDYAMNLNNLQPYIIKYDVSKVVKESADDWFYMYGYEMARECNFNYIIKDDDEIGAVDEENGIFTRTIFNYVQIQDDITTKITSDIPYVVKQKLSNIFNTGITLWTFFGFKYLYNNTNEIANYAVDKWLFKNKLENKEYKGEIYE